ncbi:MAG: 4Fe-4S binding protein [Candidatus Lokiarchaeota archaeon]|nr:4Fe-4S binding protein [Candidatus Lokiarchaeota archaeon]
MILIDKDKCLGCAVCTTICSTEAAQIDQADGKAIINNELCIECLSCINLCPEAAIYEQIENNK